MSLLCRYLVLLSVALTLRCAAQAVDVTVHVRFHGAAAGLSAETLVVWLSPADNGAIATRPIHTYKMEQKNKQFVPHLLVVPVDSTVEFPNLDPFFHNVFSQFNGRRFDLGLYETGRSQAVKVPREGISYIFCNIHPEMGGIIVSLATPYYAVSKTGDVTIRSLPPGTYKLNLWSEHATTDSLNAASKLVTISPGNPDLGVVTLETAPHGPLKHTNKYGEQYPFQP